MNNKKIILGVVALAVVGGVTWFVTKGPSGQQVSKLDPIDTVTTYYDQWLKAVKDPTNAEPSRKVLAKSPILSETLSDRLVEAQKTPNVTPDPVLCQTTVPENISVIRVYEGPEKAQVLVTSKDKKATEQAIVTLMKLDDGWYMNDIECSAGEFAPEREFSFERDGFLIKASVPAPYDKKNWHIVFEENGELGHVAPLFFDAKSECTGLDGVKAACTPDKFSEAAKVFVQGQMSERGVSVKYLKLVK